MQLIGRFLKLIRWPNLLFIALTQVLFHFCIVYSGSIKGNALLPLQLNQKFFWLLVLASIFIAAAGYIINDYFDINIDRINKPGRLILDNGISRRYALVWHLILSGLGALISIYISYATGNGLIAAGNITCIVLLWIYSTTYKRRALIGNLLIALLSGWTVLVMIVAELPMWWQGAIDSSLEKAYAARLVRIGLLYSTFAFITTLIREVVKDLEDMEGDRRDGCKTMPLLWGIMASKIFALIWIIILAGLLVVTQVYVLQFSWWWLAIYLFALVLIPSAFTAVHLMQTHHTNGYARLSRRIKFIMLCGILSMVFFVWYSR